MKVTVSVRGRFHAFDLARELARQRVLERLITPLPRFVAERFGVRVIDEDEFLDWFPGDRL